MFRFELDVQLEDMLLPVRKRANIERARWGWIAVVFSSF
jgi:hypothetical protein